MTADGVDGFRMEACPGAAFTVYAVSTVWTHRLNPTRLTVASKMVVVSGDDPLTVDEAKARGRAASERGWAGRTEEFGRPEDWELSCQAVETRVFKAVPGVVV